MILIKDAKIVKGVTKCYINVEPGVYLSGDSYGIIGKIMLDNLPVPNLDFKPSVCVISGL
jgi:hypothetical protein